MIVLSLFDGMSCGQQALERAGIQVDKYYASEIDKYAIKATMNNYPDTIQLGSVVNVDGYSLPKIDLLIGGSPCQSFSFAGKRKGMSTKDEQEILTLDHYLQLKADQFEFEGQSYLFWEYMRILKEVKPKYFLLENVMMGDKWEKILSKAIGVNPIMLNSSLFSAQNRKRLYWTNIGMEQAGLFGDLESIIPQPKDKKILLKDILQDNPNAKYYLSESAINYINRDKRNLGFQMNENDKKSGCITAVFHKQIPYNQIVVKEKNIKDEQYICQPVDEKYYLSEKMLNYLENRKDNFNSGKINYKYEDDKASCINASSGSIDISDNIIVSKEKNNNIVLKKPNVQIQKTIDKNTFKDGDVKALDFYNQSQHDKCPTLADPSHGHLGIIVPVQVTTLLKVDIVALRGRTENKNDEWHNSTHIQKAETRTDGKTNSLSTVQKDNLVHTTNSVDIYCRSGLQKNATTYKNKSTPMTAAMGMGGGHTPIIVRKVNQLSTDNKSNGGTQPYQQDRIYDINGISPALSAGKSDLMIKELNENQSKKFNPNINSDKANTLTLAQSRAGSSSEYMDSVSKIANITQRIRRLTPIECCRLQTVTDFYFKDENGNDVISETQQYRCLGNGWTVDVVAYIFGYIK